MYAFSIKIHTINSIDVCVYILTNYYAHARYAIEALSVFQIEQRPVKLFTYTYMQYYYILHILCLPMYIYECTF